MAARGTSTVMRGPWMPLPLSSAPRPFFDTVGHFLNTPQKGMVGTGARVISGRAERPYLQEQLRERPDEGRQRQFEGSRPGTPPPVAAVGTGGGGCDPGLCQSGPARPQRSQRFPWKLGKPGEQTQPGEPGLARAAFPSPPPSLPQPGQPRLVPASPPPLRWHRCASLAKHERRLLSGTPAFP